MTDEIRDGLTLDPPLDVPASPAPSPMDSDLADGMALYQKGDYQKALNRLRPYADRGETAACLLLAKIYMETGDRVRCRNYLSMAAQQGDAEAALMLAQEYAKMGELLAAMEWAERAHDQEVVGAGQLLLRLGTSQSSWEQIIPMVLSELDWLSGENRLELCRNIKTVLEGNHLPDDRLIALVEPVAASLSDEPELQQLLKEPCQAAKDRLAAKERAKKLDARQKQKTRNAAVRTKAVKKFSAIFRIPFYVLLSLALSTGGDVAAHMAVGNKFYIWWPVGGCLNCLFCGQIMRMIGKYNYLSLSEALWASTKWTVKLLIPCAIVAGLIWGLLGMQYWSAFPFGIELDYWRMLSICSAFIQGLMGCFDLWEMWD